MFPRKWRINPAYHEEASTSKECSASSKGSFWSRHDELGEIAERFVVDLNPWFVAQMFERNSSRLLSALVSRSRKAWQNSPRSWNNVHTKCAVRNQIATLNRSMDRRKLEGHGGESVNNYTYRRMIHPYLLLIDKYLMIIQDVETK